MVKLSTQPVQSVEPIEPLQTPQPSAIEIDYAQEESARAALSSRIVNDLLSRATPQSTPGSKRPFDLV
ncbi:unnamed protein product [Aureobasidium pullulans]|nr:unnamed protein product [Aureobasidium pullulans]